MALELHADDSGDRVFLNKDKPTTYKLLIESFRAWDETKRCSLGLMEDPRVSYSEASVKYCTGYLFKDLMTHIRNAERMSVPVLPAWWNEQSRAECIKVAKEMYHWDDLGAGVPVEVNEWRRYGGPGLRLPLRMMGMKIEGLTGAQAVSMGYFKVPNAGSSNGMVHAMNTP